MTSRSAREVLGVSQRTLRRMVKAGELTPLVRAVGPGGGWAFDEKQVLELAKNGRRRPGQHRRPVEDPELQELEELRGRMNELWL